MQGSKLVFASACIGILIFGISLITLGSVASDLQDQFGLDKISSGALFSILPVGILVGSLFFGPLADRYGYKMLLLVSGFLVFVGFQGIAYSGSLTLLRLCVLVFGISAGAINGATNAVVSDITETNKSANLSLLGVFFAIGALGMPFVLGSLQTTFTFNQIVSAVGVLPLVAMILFSVTKFPEPKQKEKFPIQKSISLLRNPTILLVGFFLACQSSFEGIINNWTTTYLSEKLSVPGDKALYALTLYVIGMALMRIVIGGILRNLPTQKIMRTSFFLLLAGCYLLWWSGSYEFAVAGLILIGAGLAAGFPVMLGVIGSAFAELSGTAFSIVLTLALLGNMAVNFAMGVIAEAFTIFHLTTVAFALTLIMIVLFGMIRKKSNV